MSHAILKAAEAGVGSRLNYDGNLALLDRPNPEARHGV